MTEAENEPVDYRQIAAVSGALHRSAEEDLARVQAERDAARAEAEDERAAKRVAADVSDRFRDVLADCLGHTETNPGDEVLIAELREHFGRTGPEPTRWRDFLTGVVARIDQHNAAVDDEGADRG